MKICLILAFLLLSSPLWASNACVAFQDGQGDLVQCRLDLDPIDASMIEHFNNGSKLHEYMMRKSLDYNVAYQALLQKGEEKAALVANAKGGVQLVRVSLVTQPQAHDPGGSTGGALGLQPVSHDPNGSTGGGRGLQPVSHDPGGSTGGALGLQPVSHDPGGSTGGALGLQPVSDDPGGSTGGALGMMPVAYGVNNGSFAIVPVGLKRVLPMVTIPLIAN